MDRRMLIVGGGIGGTAAALALHRAGLPATLVERAPTFAEVGAGMSLWPNATRVLRDWGILDRVIAVGEPVARFNLLTSAGRLISTLDLSGFDAPALCLHRADLHRCLREPIPTDRILGNHELVSFAQDRTGVGARFSGGDQMKAAGLIGADGIHSVVRRQLHGAGRPAYRGYCVWRGIAPDPGDLARGHISETWGAGHRFGILPMGAGRVCWYATRNGPPASGPAGMNHKDDVWRIFSRWHRPISALIEATPADAILRNDAQDRPPLPRWGDGRVTLLGDAAHPMTPNVGQGAGMAIEDAAGLAQALRTHPGVAESLAAYEARRRDRTAQVGRQARRIGAIGQWENRWMVRGRNLVTRWVLDRTPDLRRNWVYAHKI